MIHPNFAACLRPGATFKPEVFCTIQPIKDMLTPEERVYIQDMVVEAWLSRSRDDRNKRKVALSKQEVEP
jgi:hypothetical protein